VATFFKWAGRQPDEPQAAACPDDGGGEVVAASKVLPRFLSSVARRSAPVVLDLGPVVGTNVELFGERLACKLFVQDLYEELDRPEMAESDDLLATGLRARLPTVAESVDGILCWDFFDYLDGPASQALASDLVRVLKPGGVLHAFFATTAVETDFHTRFVVEADDLIRHRTYPAARRRRRVLSPREIDRLFDGLEMAESVLLKTSSRETLFRKL
jgi:SAM-dependent methyltransferase